MKKHLALGVVCLIAGFWPLASGAQVPQLINYQGRLLNGTNLVNGNIGLSLRLFDTSTLGNLLYEDSNTVTVVDGLYSTFIGDNTMSGSLSNALAATNVFIEVAVDGVALFPRERLVSVAYAIGAQSANGVAANAITASMISAGAIQSFHFAAGAVDSAAIANGAVTGANIASNTITTTNITDGSILSRDLATITDLIQPLIITNLSAATDVYGDPLIAVGTNRIVVCNQMARDGVNTNLIFSGVIKIFDAQGALVNTVFNPNATNSGIFGASVGLVGADRFAVGAPGNTSGTNKTSGVVYLFDSDGNLLVTITNPVAKPSEKFGSAIAGDTSSGNFVVGAPNKTVDTNSNCGVAYLFNYSGVFTGTITNPTPGAADNFGSVAACAPGGNYMIGAPFDDTGGTDAGCAYVYSGTNLLATVTNPAPSVSLQYGAAMSGYNGPGFLVGSRFFTSGTFTNTGIVYRYGTTGAFVGSVSNPLPGVVSIFGGVVSGSSTNGFLVTAGVGTPGPQLLLFKNDGTYLFSIARPSDNAFGTDLAAFGPNLFLVSDQKPFAEHTFVYDWRTQSTFVSGLVADVVRAGSVDSKSVADGSLTTADMNMTDFDQHNDQRYVSLAGDTMSGSLALPSDGLTVGASQLIVTAGGNVGVGVASPSFKLDVNDRIRLRGTGTVDSAGLWLFDKATGNDRAFVGLQNNGMVGFYGASGAGFDLVMNVTNGSVGFGTAPTGTNRITVAGGAFCSGNGTTWVNASDKNLKTGFDQVDANIILEKVAALPITTWYYKSESEAQKHLGPMAQDFRAAFNLGYDDKSISTVDEGGVALAAIQALDVNIRSQKATLSRLQIENAELKKQLDEFAQRLRALEVK